MFAWLNPARAKTIATVLPAVASAVAILIAAFKPTGIDASAKAYELLRQEMSSQRDEITQMHRELAELHTWVAVWREYQLQRQRQNDQMLELENNRRREKKLPILTSLPQDTSTSIAPPVPKMAPLPNPRSDLPKSNAIFN